jgi:hypothetical protein
MALGLMSHRIAAVVAIGVLGFPVYRRMGLRHVIDYQRWAG